MGRNVVALGFAVALTVILNPDWTQAQEWKVSMIDGMRRAEGRRQRRKGSKE